MRTCIFCGRGAKTREHAWPQWILNEFGSRNIEAQRGNLPVRAWRGPSASVTVKDVCGPCNQGWMSELERTTKPILLPLMQGRRATLGAVEQLTLAAWLVKTCMVFECTRPDNERFYSEEECRYLLQSAIPPPSVLGIWLGIYVGSVAAYIDAAILNQAAEFNRLTAKGYAFTLAIGNFAAQILTIRNAPQEPSVILDIEAQIEPRRGVGIRIWSPTLPAVDWPPAVPLDDHGNSIQTFSKRFVTHSGYHNA